VKKSADTFIGFDYMNVTDVQMDGQTPRYADRRTAINDRRSQKLTSLQSWRMFRTDDAGARQLMSGAAWIQCVILLATLPPVAIVRYRDDTHTEQRKCFTTIQVGPKKRGYFSIAHMFETLQ